MRAAAFWTMALLATAALSALPNQPRPSVCAAKADQAANAAHSKANSFEPHPSHTRVYGAPIQSRILKSRPKKKDPQLRSAPLPES
jgi:hypothetical protein